MKYISTNGKSRPVTFREALLQGQAPDGGLYFPDSLPQLPDTFFSDLAGKSLQDIAVAVAKPYINGDIPDEALEHIISKALSFVIPLKEIERDLYVLELFHGPTLAFKDIGARFMAGCMAWFNRNEGREVTILVATSGDTGSAVANGFLGVEGTRVIILYPKGKVSEVQEKQFTTLGHNITALEVNGTFDDCQKLVKTAFTDPELAHRLNLSSANSINMGRLLPQSFYYYYGWSQLGDRHVKPLICVPSGNFGNLTAGLMASRTGLPVDGFVAATNVNRVVPEYLETGIFTPRPSVQTFSNAMDVGNPSNLTRIMYMYNHNVKEIRKNIQGFSADDEQTMEAIADVYARTGYILDPHSAIGYLGLKHFLPEDRPGIFLSTAHPAKFGEVVKEVTGISGYRNIPGNPATTTRMLKKREKNDSDKQRI